MERLCCGLNVCPLLISLIYVGWTSQQLMELSSPCWWETSNAHYKRSIQIDSLMTYTIPVKSLIIWWLEQRWLGFGRSCQSSLNWWKIAWRAWTALQGPLVPYELSLLLFFVLYTLFFALLHLLLFLLICSSRSKDILVGSEGNELVDKNNCASVEHALAL